jgi:hypothetical protein
MTTSARLRQACRNTAEVRSSASDQFAVSRNR